VEHELSKIGKALSNTISMPISNGYHPELDVSPLLSPEQANYFQNLVGMLRWIIELGRLYIHVHISMLSTFLASPCKGHLNEVLHIFAYLKRYKKSTMVFDDTLPNFDESIFQKNTDWPNFYHDAAEKIPPMPLNHEVTQSTCIVFVTPIMLEIVLLGVHRVVLYYSLTVRKLSGSLRNKTLLRLLPWSRICGITYCSGAHRVPLLQTLNDGYSY